MEQQASKDVTTSHWPDDTPALVDQEVPRHETGFCRSMPLRRQSTLSIQLVLFADGSTMAWNLTTVNGFVRTWGCRDDGFGRQPCGLFGWALPLEG